VYACTFVDGVCKEFDARQAAVRAAPDAASVQARAEGYASAAAKAEAEAAAKAEAIAAASAKAPRTVELLLRLDMQDHIPSFMSARLAPCFPCRVEPPTRLLSYSDARFTRKAKVTDAILAVLTDQQLEKLGLEVGEVASFKMNVSAAALQPLTLAAGGGGGGGGIAVVTSAMSSLSVSAPLRNHLQPLLNTEYRGVIAIVAGHVPSLSCAQCMLQHLATVLPEVVRMDFIVQECTRKLESLHALTLPADMAFAIVAYTYDLGLSSATDDGR